MKNIKIISLMLITVLFAGCEQDFNDDDFRPRDRTSGWIQFSTSSQTELLFDVGEVAIPFQIEVPENKEGFTFQYSVEVVSGDAPAVETGTFTAEVDPDTNTFERTISVDPENVSKYSVEVTLLSVSEENISVGIEGSGRPTVYTLNITDECDVPLNYVGSTNFNGNQDVNQFDMTLTPTDDPNVFEMDTAWGDFVDAVTADDFSGQFPYSGTLTINEDDTVDFVADNAGAFPNGGSGTISTCNGTMTLVLTQGIFGDPFEVTVNYTQPE